MARMTVEGIYENGKVVLAARPEGIERAKVRVTFLIDARASRARQGGKGKEPDVQRAVPPEAQDRYSPILREEYKALIQKKLRRLLTEGDAARLKEVRAEINRLDGQTESWPARETRAREVEQELDNIRRELEAMPDA